MVLAPSRSQAAMAAWLARVMGATGLAALAVAGVVLAIAARALSEGGGVPLRAVAAAIGLTALSAAHFLAAAEVGAGRARGLALAAGLAVLELLVTLGVAMSAWPLRSEAWALGAVIALTLLVELVVIARLRAHARAT